MKKLVVTGSFFLVASLLAAPYGTPESKTSSGNSYMNSGREMDSMQKYDNSKGSTTTLEAKDRFTSTEDHKLGGQIRVQIAEIIGAPKAGEVFLIIDSGDVKLIGKVPNEESKAKIIQAIHQIKGVKSINNKLELEKK